jgi:opine dehydrogenase
MTKVAVLGSGNGAFAMAGDLAMQGFEVAMWSPRAEWLEAIRESKTIRLSGPTVQGEGTLSLVTTQIDEAVKGAEVVCMPIPAYTHVTVAEALAPHLEDGQVLFLSPGSFGSFVMARAMHELGNRKEFMTCETGTLPYLTRKVQPDESKIVVRACNLPTGVFPARLTDEAIGKLREVVPAAHPVEDALSGALMNAGPVIHPPLVVMNTGPIENEPHYDIHNEGTSPGIRTVQRALDAERIEIREALGYRPNHYPLDDYYNDDAPNEWMYPRSAKKLLMESRLWDEKVDYSHRYVTEDIALGLAFLVSVADLVGLEAPTARSLLRLAGAVTGQDYLKTGRTISAAGFGGLSSAQVRDLLHQGFAADPAQRVYYR